MKKNYVQPKRNFYLISVQYLGYRLHGWQRQPGMKTVESLIKKTLKFVLPGRRFKILGAGRTDAMVSAEAAAFELFLEGEELQDLPDFLDEFNRNLPPDIRALEIKPVDADFNIIQHPKLKEYAYFFSFGKKNHPFCAPLMANFLEDFDIELMKKGAQLYEGEHNFKNFCVSSSNKSHFTRKIIKAEIVENTLISASFFPEQSFVFLVQGSGFLRYQIRLMMGTLVQLGRGELQLKDIETALNPETDQQMTFIAPASGLVLRQMKFENSSKWSVKSGQ